MWWNFWQWWAHSFFIAIVINSNGGEIGKGSLWCKDVEASERVQSGASGFIWQCGFKPASGHTEGTPCWFGCGDGKELFDETVYHHGCSEDWQQGLP